MPATVARAGLCSCADDRRLPMKKVVGLIKDASVEQRSRVKEAVQTAMQDGSLEVEYVS